jgi:hypothetical protein
MVNKAGAAAAAVGIAGAGVALGYFLPALFKPKITISPNPATAGAIVTFTYSGFRPNSSLMSMGGGTGGIGSAPLNIGGTDQNGNLKIIGAAPDLQSGTKVLYVVFDAANPEIFATAIYTQA